MPPSPPRSLPSDPPDSFLALAPSLLLACLALLLSLPGLLLVYKILRRPRQPAIFNQSLALSVATASLLMPVGLLANMLMLQVPEQRSILCGVLIETRFVIGIVYAMSLFFSFLFRTFLILHSDRGLVNKAGPNLKLFNQLFWTVLAAFILVLLGTYPTSHQLRGIYPEGTKRGKICLQLNFPEDKDFLDEGLKLRIINVIFPFLFGIAILLLNMKVKRFLAGHCPRKRMSCIGVYQRNVITYTQTTWLMLCWVLSAFLDALLILLVELNSKSSSPQTRESSQMLSI
jgi:hypothetical protein